MSTAPDQDAVCREALRHRPALIAYAYTLLRDWHRAEDVVQDATVLLIRKDECFEAIEAVPTWLRRTVRYKCLEVSRKRRRERPTGDELLDTLAEAAVDRHLEAGGGGDQALRVRALTACIEGLSERKRRIFRGYYVKRESCERIAEALGSSANAIHQALSRLRRALHDCATRRLGEERVT